MKALLSTLISCRSTYNLLDNADAILAQGLCPCIAVVPLTTYWTMPVSNCLPDVTRPMVGRPLGEFENQTEPGNQPAAAPVTESICRT